MGDVIYAVGDLHGQREMLDSALTLIEGDGGTNAPVVFLGDLVDRGPDSRGVIEILMRGQAEGRNWTVLKGNHDRMFQRYLDDGRLDDPRVVSGVDWMNPRLGGPATLASYGVDVEGRVASDILADARVAVPDAHQSFVSNLALTHVFGDLLFVHAGIAPQVDLADQTEDDLLWIRAPFLEFEGAHPFMIVHGHTALDAPHHHGNRINLDSGAGYGRPVTAAVFEAGEVFVLTGQGRVPLRP